MILFFFLRLNSPQTNSLTSVCSTPCRLVHAWRVCAVTNTNAPWAWSPNQRSQFLAVMRQHDMTAGLKYRLTAMPPPPPPCCPPPRPSCCWILFPFFFLLLIEPCVSFSVPLMSLCSEGDVLKGQVDAHWRRLFKWKAHQQINKRNKHGELTHEHQQLCCLLD